ncbi:SCO3374 family protein [Streptomyces sp. MST-110588]|uniref:SCO3374 family protein n=1 Tax=Streptomyces sp. MST-110588 TaxID=2833628 RepID=UPI001F5C10B8|nr:SCO3374 family protein [Streptomyces sp. MST-110588]UNO43932.1 hypothetical protein KGS77_14700 [Streptomyces sp. MST-110588]
MSVAPPRPCGPLATVRRWYEDELGWATAGSDPVELLTGVRFDALEMPADAGYAVLRRVPETGPVALVKGPWNGRPTMLALIAAGSAEELPGLLEWLEWGPLVPDLTARGAGDRMPAPSPRGFGAREAAGWVRPPEPGREVETTLPVTGVGAGFGGDNGTPPTKRKGRAPDLVRLVSAAATECHRARLTRSRNARTQADRGYGDQPLAFSYASRMSAGTRPRSLTL